MSNELKGLMNQLSGVGKEINEFRSECEKRHAGKEPMERIEALLIDLLCVMYMEFYIRPRFKGED